MDIILCNPPFSSLFLQVKVNPGYSPGTLPYDPPLLNTLLLLLQLSFHKQQPRQVDSIQKALR